MSKSKQDSGTGADFPRESSMHPLRCGISPSLVVSDRVSIRRIDGLDRAPDFECLCRIFPGWSRGVECRDLLSTAIQKSGGEALVEEDMGSRQKQFVFLRAVLFRHLTLV